MGRITFVVVLMIVLCSTMTVADDFTRQLVPDALVLIRPADGSIEGDTLEGASWEIYKNPFPAVLNGRDLWFDLVTPTNKMGFGLSLDIVPDTAACIGGAWRDDVFFGYIGAHIEFGM